MYTIISFHIVLREHLNNYIENMRLCARQSTAEPGCVRYEVLQDEDDETVFCLTQVFRDEDAYRAHQVAEHHLHWMNISADWRDRSKHTRHQLRFITPEPELLPTVSSS